MAASPKDKRTKEQILKLLDHAMEQEEHLIQKINNLDAELTECRKKAADPRRELTEEALTSSKISFRVDFYRTAANNPLKGIIEHLPSRQNQAFEGEGRETISDFIAVFLKEETGDTRRKKPVAAGKAMAGNNPAATPARPQAAIPQVSPDSGPSLLERLKARHRAAGQAIVTAEMAEAHKNTPRQAMPSGKPSSLAGRLREKHAAYQKSGTAAVPQQPTAENAPASRPSRLLERLRAEYKGKMP